MTGSDGTADPIAQRPGDVVKTGEAGTETVTIPAEETAAWGALLDDVFVITKNWGMSHTAGGRGYSDGPDQARNGSGRDGDRATRGISC